MPFDGSKFEYGLVRLFDEMLEFFGPDGERRAQGVQVGGGRCLVGALSRCGAKLKMPKQDDAARYLRAAIRNHKRGNRISIVQFNDHEQRCSKMSVTCWWPRGEWPAPATSACAMTGS